MNELFSSDEHGPVTWVGGHPVYGAHYLALGFAISMVVTALLSAFNFGLALAWLSFSSSDVLRGEIWRIFTYGMVNQPSIWFAIELLMIVWFGREVEKFFGRRKFFALYACLYVIPPLLMTLFGLLRANALVGESVGFALFVAFATLYPNAQVLFSLLAKWVAWILLGVYALQALSVHDWLSLITLLATSGFAYGFVLWQMGRFQLLPASFPTRSFSARSRKEVSRVESRRSLPQDSSMQDVDALLDKIARSGFQSLTPKERATLDAAREKIRKRSGR
jgi:hypothetical protein